MKRKLVGILLAITMIVSFIPTTTFAVADDNAPKAWVEGYADGSTSNFRSSQMLMVKTSGFSDRADLKYHYYSQSSDNSFAVFNYGLLIGWPLVKLDTPPASTGGLFGFIGSFVNAVASVVDAFYEEDTESESPYFAVTGTPAANMKIRIVITDTNELSETYNKKVEIKVGPFTTANMTKDIDTAYTMFVGDVKTAPELLAASGVGHIYPGCDECATINSLVFENVDEGTIEEHAADRKYSDVEIKAVKPGLAKMKISITKSETCTYQPGLTGVANAYIKVFDRVVATPVDDGFDLTNTEAGVTYTIGSQSQTCKTEGETLSFRNLAGGREYEIICSQVLPNKKTAKVSVTARTLNPWAIEFSVIRHASTTDIPEAQQASRNNQEKVAEPEQGKGPYAPGYVIGKWYEDPAFTTLYDFNDFVTSDIKLYGKWLKLKHTARINLTLDGEAYTGRKVELYQDYQKKYTLTETDTAGTYQLEDAVETGIYDIYIDGYDAYFQLDMAGTKTELDLTSEQLDALISGESFSADVEMISLDTTCLLDGKPADIGTVFYRNDKGIRLTATYIDDANGKRYTAATSVTDPYNQDIFVNSADSDRYGANDQTKNISVENHERTLEFYNMTLKVKIDDADWVSDNVVLRDRNGNLAAKLKPESYNNDNGTRTFSFIMQKDEKNVPEEYTVYLDGADTGIKLAAVADNHSKTISAYKAAVNVTKDSNAWNDAVVTLSNDKYCYTLYTGTNGAYETALIYDKDDEKKYTVSVGGTIDQSENNFSSISHAALNMDFYSVKYYSYKAGAVDGTYELNDTKLYREQTVRSGSKALQVTSPYVGGLSFNCFAVSEWTLGEDPVAAYDFNNSPVTGPLTLYAHFESPEVNINGFVKSDENGNILGTGDHFKLANLTISGFDEGKAIKSIIINSANIDEITFAENDMATVASKTDYHVITFNEKVSMTEAQVYLRNAVFKPVHDADVNMTITVSDGVAGAESESTFTQAVTTDANWIKLSSVQGYSNAGTNGLSLSTGNYYVDKSVTIGNSTAGKNGLSISGKVKLYIPYGVTVTANGAAGSGTTGGGAGVYLPSGSSLYLYGEGTLNAEGGKAGDGEKGLDGENSWFDHASEYYYTRSGRGGNGGGGAGAGIGTDGGSGATGGAAVGNYAYTDEKLEKYGEWGSNGNGGNQASDSGNVYYYGVHVNANGGGAGNSPTSSSTSKNAAFDKWQRLYSAGSSGGGGNGAPGRKGNNIGSGGSGGAGGGAGGAGGITWSEYDNYYYPAGGHGGNADGSAGRTDGSYSGDVSGGNGGYGGTTPVNRNPKYLQECEALSSYKITFAESEETPTDYYLYSKNVIAYVPDYTPDTGRFFVGWRVSTYGKNVNGTDISKPLTTAEAKLYQPGETIKLAELTYGNIVLKPVTIAIAGKSDSDKMTIDKSVFAQEAPEITYYTYSVAAKLNGEAADIGTITLKPTEGGDDISLGGNGTGTYSFTTTTNTTYRIYLNGEDTDETVTSSENAQVDVSRITVKTTLDGNVSIAPGDVSLAVNGASLAAVSVLSGGIPTGEYRVQKLSKDMPDDAEYEIYVGGRNTGKTAKAGDTITVDYYKACVTVNGNVVVESVILKNTAKGNIFLTKSGSEYSAICQKDEITEYAVYVNDQDTGKTIKLSEEGKSAAVTGNVLTAAIRVNGEPSDATGYIPVYKASAMEKTGTGTYQTTEYGEIAKAVIEGDEKEFTDNSCIFDYYTVSYDIKGGAGTTPTDAAYYIINSTPMVIEANDISKENSQMQGWSIGDNLAKIYKGGDSLPGITSRIVLKAVWKSLSDYPLIIVKNGNPIHADTADLKKILDERNYPAAGDGKPGLTIIVNKDVELPDDTYLGPLDELIINSPVSATVTDLINEGKITVGEGGKLDITGTLENKNEFKNDGDITVNEGGILKNEKNAVLENSSIIEVENTATVTNIGNFNNKQDGKVSIGGYFENNEDGTLTNDGEITVDESMNNDGELINNGTVKGSGTLDNNGNINGIGGGTLELSVDNKDGAVIGGKLKTPGSINGGTVMGMDTSEGTATDTKDSPSGKSSKHAAGGTLPASPTQIDIDNIFGMGNAILATDGNGALILDENGGYFIIIVNGTKLNTPVEISEGVNVTIELAGNKLVGPDGQPAIKVTGGSLNLMDSIGDGAVSGGMGTTENGGDGNGGTGIELTGNGRLFIDESAAVSGGPGVGNGSGGSGIDVSLASDTSIGGITVNGTVSGGNGGSDVSGDSGNGGNGMVINSAPESSVVIRPLADISGGSGGTSAEGKSGQTGRESEISADAKKSVYEEPISNADGVEIILCGNLTYNGDVQTQEVMVKVNGVEVSPTDYVVTRNKKVNAGTYTLMVVFNSDIDPEKPYADLKEKEYYRKFTISSGHKDSIITDRKNGIRKLKNASLGEYSEENQKKIDEILSNAEKDINNAKSKSEIDRIVKDALSKIKEIPTIQEEQGSLNPKQVLSEVKIRANSKYVKLNGRYVTQIYTKVLEGKTELEKLEEAGYTVKYDFYRSTMKKNGFKKMYTKETDTYCNTYGTRGKMYYYKVILRVYDNEGILAASTKLTQCKYGNRKFRGYKN